MAKRKATQAAASPSKKSSAKPVGSKAGKAPERIYQLKITLQDVRPPIWRRLQVPDLSLNKLHEIIQVAMGWDNYHLYSFEIGGNSYTDPRAADDLDMENAARTKLSDAVPRENIKFHYVYDFGDNWDHQILVEKILPPVDGQKYPVCVKGKRAGPPEDVGGSWGYDEFVEAIQDPKHERHEELLEWVGGEFDPEAFDIDALNADLRQLK